MVATFPEERKKTKKLFSNMHTRYIVRVYIRIHTHIYLVYIFTQLEILIIFYIFLSDSWLHRKRNRTTPPPPALEKKRRICRVPTYLTKAPQSLAYQVFIGIKNNRCERDRGFRRNSSLKAVCVIHIYMYFDCAYYNSSPCFIWASCRVKKPVCEEDKIWSCRIQGVGVSISAKIKLEERNIWRLHVACHPPAPFPHVQRANPFGRTPGLKTRESALYSY